jgi:hypothetical protein
MDNNVPPVEDLTSGDAALSALAAMWAELLILPQVGPETNFFQAGGYSLLATQLMAQVSDTLGVRLPMRTLFDHPTLGEFAAVVRDSLTADSSPKTPPAVYPQTRRASDGQ